ncbi:MAG: iron-containing alcohol dehydrogenase [Proteobacteria bacterium]|nr:iron-containing alcohol dehydrogenase [Pseudomonadota bacterium]MBU1060504.1 iron-containing alcohol dehydrogenase [Pseudomonadota bacterium]
MISLKSPNLILAGFGALDKMGEEAKSLDVKKALMVTDAGIQASGIGAKVEKVLRDNGVKVTIFDKVTSDPDIACCESCICEAKKGGYELIVGVGGGSPMDIASITSLMCTNPGAIQDYFGINLLKKQGIPTFLVATTSGTGAEVTPNAILTDPEAKLKKGVVSPFILPRAAIIDPILTLSMPPRVTSFTGMDALTHAIESYTSMNATPLTDMYAREAIRLIGRSLRTAVAKGEKLEARADMSMGSLYAGISLANAGVGAVHALAYPLGGEFNIPHGIANGLLLPHVMAFNLIGDVEKFADIARLLGEEVEGLSKVEQARRSAVAVKNLLADVDMPKTLSELNIPENAIDRLAAAAMNVTRLMVNNPRNMTCEDAVTIFKNAF